MQFEMIRIYRYRDFTSCINCNVLFVMLRFSVVMASFPNVIFPSLQLATHLEISAWTDSRVFCTPQGPWIERRGPGTP